MEQTLPLGQLVARRRKALGMSQRDLAQAAEISPAYVGWIERADRTPSRRITRAIADALGFSTDSLFRAAGYLPDGAPMTLDPEEAELVGLYRRALPALRRAMLAALRATGE